MLGFQSLLHQGISLLAVLNPLLAWTGGTVSIPSSSGHQFTVGRLVYSRGVFVVVFQSLLHQGISLLRYKEMLASPPEIGVSIPSSSGHQFTDGACRVLQHGMCICFNPFFIRASVYCFSPPAPSAMPLITVSIPSSSGHQFTAINLWRSGMTTACSFNPFFIRASVY